MKNAGRFQSTLPARGATKSDHVVVFIFPYFNPRSPHGERPVQRLRHPRYADFNPRSPHGERRTR